PGVRFAHPRLSSFRPAGAEFVTVLMNQSSKESTEVARSSACATKAAIIKAQKAPELREPITATPNALSARMSGIRVTKRAIVHADGPRISADVADLAAWVILVDAERLGRVPVVCL